MQKEMEEWSGCIYMCINVNVFVGMEMAMLSRSSALPFCKCHKLALRVSVFCWPEIVFLTGSLIFRIRMPKLQPRLVFSFMYVCVISVYQPTQSSFHTFLECGGFTVRQTFEPSLVSLIAHLFSLIALKYSLLSLDCKGAF